MNRSKVRSTRNAIVLNVHCMACGMNMVVALARNEYLMLDKWQSACVHSLASLVFSAPFMAAEIPPSEVAETPNPNLIQP